MQDYNFWADLLASYRASPDIIKALWVLTPPGFVLGLVAVLRLTQRQEDAMPEDRQRLERFGSSATGLPPLIPLPGPSPRERGEGGWSRH